MPSPQLRGSPQPISCGPIEAIVPSNQSSTGDADLRSQSAAAPLKLRIAPAARSIRPASPQPISCGPIEAAPKCRSWSKTRSSPQPISCGPIEAPGSLLSAGHRVRSPQPISCGPIEADQFHRDRSGCRAHLRSQSAAAPLKRQLLSSRRHRTQASPQPISCGPIEARTATDTTTIRAASPQPISCGPIEARRSTTARMAGS